MIEFAGVHFSYPDGTWALRGVDLKIDDGELVAIAGENGAGKTTLVKHMNGLLKPSRGVVRVDGEDTRAVGVERLSRRVGLAFQTPEHQLFCGTVEEEVALGLRLRGLGGRELEERVTWALGYFGLAEKRLRSPLELSEGEKKRLAVASVAACDPPVLVLDEPTIGLDLRYRERLLKLIEGRRARGLTTVVVTQDVELLWALRPRLVLMAEGSVEEDGPIEEVLAGARLERAGLVRPQLLELHLLLKRRPERPFGGVEDAFSWLMGVLERGHAPPR
jgi:energy-coupling factor transport system ATP-binding protein